MVCSSSQLPTSPGDNGSEELREGDRPISSWHQSQQLLQPSHALFPSRPNFHVFLLCSFCRTAFPCQVPALVTVPQLGPRCMEVFLREACIPSPSFLHCHRIRPRRVCSISTSTELGRRKLVIR